MKRNPRLSTAPTREMEEQAQARAIAKVCERAGPNGFEPRSGFEALAAARAERMGLVRKIAHNTYAVAP